ncbi:hypothetical protein C2869_19210 [Saccharobesus litoralis]|uniref:Acyltransferase n=1 Tax=Saccharobesus litoralis TaxID=2172099 RepID=A0A2S0VW48_9ALTE|nr:hypothetical protein [Saccharobesus litoralis]AWB68403.1 hypothetical protein C2869_19210 [Saccharobesus litoralis]
MLDGLKRTDTGKNNKVTIGSSVRANDSEFIISGENNVIEIGDGTVLNKVKIIVESSNNKIVIGNNCRVTCRVIQKISDGNTFTVGDGTTIGGANFINGESSTIKIGSQCMFSYNIDVRSTDSHAVFDLGTDERINQAENIVIEDNVWVGAHVVLCKGSYIGSGSIVGISSVVAKAFKDKNIAVAGNPAKIIKEGVYWERPLLG